MKFGIFLEFWFLALLEVQGLVYVTNQTASGKNREKRLHKEVKLPWLSDLCWQQPRARYWSISSTVSQSIIVRVAENFSVSEWGSYSEICYLWKTVKSFHIVIGKLNFLRENVCNSSHYPTKPSCKETVSETLNAQSHDRVPVARMKKRNITLPPRATQQADQAGYQIWFCHIELDGDNKYPIANKHITYRTASSKQQEKRTDKEVKLPWFSDGS